MTVNLLSGDTTEVSLPRSVTIPADLASITVPLDAVDDQLLDGTQPVTMWASAPGYVEGSATVQVQDYETLSLVIAPAEVSENGGSVTGIVTRSNTDTTVPLTVSLRSSDTSEALVPASVTIPANRASASFTVAGVDDSVVDGLQSVTVVASASGYVDASSTVKVQDYESLAIAIASPQISENGGAATGTVTRSNTDVQTPLTVNLQSSDTSEAVVPASITIPANQASASFSIASADDSVLDGTQSVTIRASAAGYYGGSAVVQVQDFETLSLAITPMEISENGGSATATVTRNNTDRGTSITIALRGSDTSEALVPASVTISANQASAAFAVSGIDDSLLDGMQSVTILASSQGYIDASASVEVQDYETVSLAISPPTISENGGSAVGTVTRSNSDIEQSLTVALASSDLTAATVPTTVVIPANESSVPFQVTAVADNVRDGTQTVTIYASAQGYIGGSQAIDVRDNDPPVLTPLGDRTVYELSELTFTASATDSDLPANVLTFSLLNGPAGASIAATTGSFRWTPTEDQGPGTYELTVKVTDNGTPQLSDEELITITVGEANAAPLLAAIGDETIDELTTLSFVAAATDDDVPANGLAYSLLEAPIGATIDSATGDFRWTPNEARGPGVYTMKVRVADTGTPPLSDEKRFTVTVGEVNSAPVLATIGDETIDELTTQSFVAAATDDDVPANGLAYSLLETPIGATIDSATGDFRWTPTEVQGPGVYTLKVRVTDTGTPPLTDEELITVTVGEVNSAPVFGTVGDKTVDELATLTFAASASDPDVPANALTFSLVHGPSNATIDPATGVFSWTPTESEGPGTYPVTIHVADDAVPGLHAWETFHIVVAEVNNPPSAIALSGSTVKERVLGATVGVLSATDPDVGQTHWFALADENSPCEIVGATLKMKADEYLDIAESSTIEVAIVVTDSGTPAGRWTSVFSLGVIANPRPWSHPAKRLDVNADGVVAPFDALLIINELNSPAVIGLNGSLPPAKPETGFYYYDTNADGFGTPLDALAIINHLNTGSGGEGKDTSGSSLIPLWPFTNIGLPQGPPRSAPEDPGDLPSFGGGETACNPAAATDRCFAAPAGLSSDAREESLPPAHGEPELECLLGDIVADISARRGRIRLGHLLALNDSWKERHEGRVGQSETLGG